MITEPNRPIDDLDARIRGLMADAVAAAPRPPALPDGDARVVPIASARRRSVVFAAIGVAAAVVAAAVVFLSRDERSSLVPAVTSTPVTTTAALWPDGVAVVVASDRGIERVALEDGLPVVTRVLPDVQASLAFELADGSTVYQAISPTGAQGGIYLRQPNGDTKGPLFEGQRVELHDADRRPDGRVPFTYSQVRPDNQSQPLWFGVGAFMDQVNPVLFEGPRGNQLPGQLDRATLLSPEQFVQGEADDLGVRSGVTFDLQGNVVSEIEGAADAARLVADGSFNVGMLAADGTFSTTGRRAQKFGRVLPTGAVVDDVTDLDLRGNWLLVSLRNRPTVLHDLATGSDYEVPVASGRATLVRSQRLGDWLFGGDPAPVDSTTTSSTVAVTTTIPDSVYNPSSCMQFTADPLPAGLQVSSYGFYSMEPIPTEPTTVDGKPAVLQTWGGGLGAVVGAPYWCSQLAFTLLPDAAGTPPDRAAFLDWLATVDIVEQLPEGMPPVVLAGPSGVARLTQQGTTTVTTSPAFRAVLLADGDVVWQELGSDPSTGGYRPELTHLWSAVTGDDTELWAAVDWVATPMLHDALPDGRIAFSVGDTLLIQDPLGQTSQSVPLGLTPSGRLSVSLRDQLVAGEGLYATIDQTGSVLAPAPPDFWRCTSACAFDMNGATAALASEVDLRVVDRTTRQTLFSMPWGDSAITDVDIRGKWLSYYASPLGDTDETVRVMDYTTGVGFAFQGWWSAHFSRTP